MSNVFPNIFLKRFTICAHLLFYGVSAMDVIFDELQKNNVNIDKATFSYHIHHCLENYTTMYGQMTMRSSLADLHEIFYDMNVNNFGRVIAFLTYVYVLNGPEGETRRAVQLAVTPLKSFDITTFKIEESFFEKMVSFAKRFFSIK